MFKEEDSISLAMLEYTEVSFHVLINVNEGGGSISDFIMNSIKNIGGIVTISHANSTNTIYVSSSRNESEIDDKIKQIQNIEHVTGIRDIEDRSVKIASAHFEDPNKSPDKMVDKALSCVEFLKAKYESMVT